MRTYVSVKSLDTEVALPPVVREWLCHLLCGQWLCHLMCGRSLTFRKGSIRIWGYAPNAN